MSNSIYQRLLETMAALRAEDGCQWDRKQTHQSLKKHLIEEAAEVLDAIDSDNPDHLREELGDLLWQVIFHAQIAHENERFHFDDLVTELTEKIIRRHPHVFGELEINDDIELKKQWEKIKAAEKADQPDAPTSALDNIPKALNALQYADKHLVKARRSEIVHAELLPNRQKALQSCDKLLSQNPSALTEAEAADLLFAVAEAFTHTDFNPEQLLRSRTNQFASQFRQLEQGEI